MRKLLVAVSLLGFAANMYAADTHDYSTYAVKRTVEEVDGKFVLKANLFKSGLMLLVK